MRVESEAGSDLPWTKVGQRRREEAGGGGRDDHGAEFLRALSVARPSGASAAALPPSSGPEPWLPSHSEQGELEADPVASRLQSVADELRRRTAASTPDGASDSDPPHRALATASTRETQGTPPGVAMESIALAAQHAAAQRAQVQRAASAAQSQQKALQQAASQQAAFQRAIAARSSAERAARSATDPRITSSPRSSATVAGLGRARQAGLSASSAGAVAPRPQSGDASRASLLAAAQRAAVQRGEMQRGEPQRGEAQRGELQRREVQSALSAAQVRQAALARAAHEATSRARADAGPAAQGQASRLAGTASIARQAEGAAGPAARAMERPRSSSAAAGERLSATHPGVEAASRRAGQASQGDLANAPARSAAPARSSFAPQQDAPELVQRSVREPARYEMRDASGRETPMAAEPGGQATLGPSVRILEARESSAASRRAGAQAQREPLAAPAGRDQGDTRPRATAQRPASSEAGAREQAADRAVGVAPAHEAEPAGGAARQSDAGRVAHSAAGQSADPSTTATSDPNAGSRASAGAALDGDADSATPRRVLGAEGAVAEPQEPGEPLAVPGGKPVATLPSALVTLRAAHSVAPAGSDPAEAQQGLPVVDPGVGDEQGGSSGKAEVGAASSPDDPSNQGAASRALARSVAGSTSTQGDADATLVAARGAQPRAASAAREALSLAATAQARGEAAASGDTPPPAVQDAPQGDATADGGASLARAARLGGSALGAGGAGASPAQQRRVRAADAAAGEAAGEAASRQSAQPGPAPAREGAARSTAAAPSAPAEAPAWVERVQGVMRALGDRHGAQVRLSLEPEDLGRLEVSIQMRADGVHATVLAEHEPSRALIAGQEQMLRQALERTDLRLSSFSVQVGAGDGQDGSAHEREPAEPSAGGVARRTGRREEPVEILQPSAAAAPGRLSVRA